MATEFLKSTILTNRDARPQIPNPLTVAGRNFQKRGIVTSTSGVLSTSQYGFFDLPSNAVIVSVELSNIASGGASAADFGLWEKQVASATAWATTAGSVANAGQYFGAAVSLVAAGFKVQCLLQTAWTTVAKMDQAIWQVLGLAADPHTFYDVVLTATQTITTGGAYCAEISYKLQ